MAKAFFDTNILLYLISADAAKADQAEQRLALGGHISVQVLNEFASVARRKLGMNLEEIRDVLAPLRGLCQVHPLTLATHDRALAVAERYGFSIYDALIAAAALEAGCDTLYSEDLQHGQRIDGQLTISNPFKA